MAAIINSGKQYITDNIAGNVPSQITRFILATVPHSDPTIPVNLDETMPSAGQIVYDEPITRTAKINPDEVVYSQLLLSDVGDFDFNWIGLATDDHTLIAVVYVPTQHKRKYEHRQVGNSLTRNVVLKFANAAEALDVTIAPETWQFDITDFVRDEIQKGIDGHDHNDAYYPKAKTNELLDEKVDKSAITDNTSSTSSVLVASAKALKTVKDIAAEKWTYVTATTGRYGATLLSNLYNGSSQTKAVTELALKNGLATKPSANHNHDLAYWKRGERVNDAAQLNGHGLTDAPTADTVAKRSSSGDLLARLFRSNYATDSFITGALAFRVNDGSDNFIRFCSNIAAIKQWLSAASKPDYHYNTGDITLTRKAERTVIQRWTNQDATISIDVSTFQVGDIITIVNVRQDSGVVTITNLDGTIYVHNNSNAATHTFSGMGQVSFIRYGTGDNLMEMTE